MTAVFTSLFTAFFYYAAYTTAAADMGTAVLRNICTRVRYILAQRPRGRVFTYDIYLMSRLSYVRVGNVSVNSTDWYICRSSFFVNKLFHIKRAIYRAYPGKFTAEKLPR